jgi:protein-L-isoaspartate O-methyltransferase
MRCEVPRERFAEAGFEELPYEGGTLPIANEQSISQRQIVR